LLKLGALTAMVPIGLLTAYVLAAPVAAQDGEGTCIVGATKIDDPGDSLVINAPAGEVITQVAIKAGSSQSGGGCFLFPPLTSSSCYTVDGLGTSTVTINRIGDGPTCKGISHVEYTTTTDTTTTTTTDSTTTTTTDTTITTTETT